MTARIGRLDGITPILSMPFDIDEEIIPGELRAQVDFLAGTGVRAVGFGFGSEIARLTDGEIGDALRLVVDHAEGRLEVLATIGGGSIRALVKHGAKAADAGAHALMMRPPPGSTEAETVTACQELWEGAGLPIVFQDAPDVTLVDIAPESLGELVERVPGVVALKIESPDPAAKIGVVSGLLGDTVSILGGAGGIGFLDELERGAHGTVPFVALAPEFVRVHRLHSERRGEDASRCFEQIRPVLQLALRDADTAYFAFKELLRRRGVMRDGVRLRRPGRAPDSGFLAELGETLAASGGRTASAAAVRR